MNPMALLLALLASVGAAGALSGGRSRNVDRNDDDDDDGTSGDGGSSGGGSKGGGSKGGGSTDEPDYQVTLPTPPVQTGGTGTDGGNVAPTPITGQSVSMMTGRMATLAPPSDDVASIRIVTQPKVGHVSVNPDKTLAVVLTDTIETGPMSFSYEITHSDGTKSLHTTPLEVTPGLQQAGWGTSEKHYMLEVDENDRVVVEHGENHRAVYISSSDKALTLADIAAREGLTVDKITGGWLAAHPEYGSSEANVLAQDAGFRLWNTISGRGSNTSNWLLLERGYTYDEVTQLVGRESSGESELHPIHIGAWGEGAKPEISSSVMIFQGVAKNIVIQDLHFTGGLRVLEGQNIIFDNIAVTGHEMTVELNASGITIRNSEFYDIFREEPVNDGATWEPAMNRVSGLFVSRTDGVLLEGNFFDQNGWEQGYRYDASTAAGQPPSMYNHNIYIQYDSSDITLRDSIIMRGASFGTQFRSGGFLEDNVFLDNNGAVNPAVEGNYTLAADNIVTSAGYKRVAIAEGALNWGIDNMGYLNTYVDNVIAHMADPNNLAEVAAKPTAGLPLMLKQSPFYNDTIIWNWGKTPENIDGLDTSVLNQTTIQRFTAQLLNKPDATINDLATYLRAQAGGTFDDVVDADLIIRFFQSGFGIAPDIRTDTGMIRFIPDELGEGTRWDNRLNWSTEDLPGSVNGDSVDLGGNKVIFGGNATINQMEFGANGGLQLEHGKLTVAGGMETGADPATLDVNGAGQIWTEGGRGAGKLDIDVTGGRFANTGDFQMNSDLTASGGQTLLGVDSATYAVTKGSRLEVLGDGSEVGFDGQQNGIAILGLGKEGTLAFTADNGKLGSIEEFRSGAFEDAPQVLSGADLGGGKLQLDLTELVDASGTFTLVNVDELIGSFGSTNITGLGGRNAEIVIDYQTDSIMLKLAAGEGTVKTTFVGNQNTADAGEAALMDALTAGRGSYDNADQAQDDEEYLYDAA